MNMKKTADKDERIFWMAEKEIWTVPDSCADHVERILDNLPEITKEEGIRRLPRKRMLLLAAALAAVFGVTAAAAELFSWDEQAVESFDNPTEEEQDTMVMEGIAKEQNVSATDAGLTVTAVQTMQDKNSLYILLELESEEDIIDGNSCFENVTDGVYSPMLFASDNGEDAFNNIGYSAPPEADAYTLGKHGYYEISALKSLEQEWTSDSVTVQFTDYIYFTGTNKHDLESHHLKGNWTLTIPLGENNTLRTDTYELNQEVDIKGVPVEVKRVELSPLSMHLVFDMDDVNRLWDTLYPGAEDVPGLELQFAGFLDKNGREIISGAGGGQSAKYDFENREIIREMAFGCYVNVDQAITLLLGTDEIVQIPLQ